MSHFNESRSIPASPSPRPPVCDDCEEPYGDDDLRIKHNHWRVGIITICERCDAAFKKAAKEEAEMETE